MSPDGSNKNQFAAAAYLEDEVKLDALDPRLITEVWNTVLRRTKHFRPAFHNHTSGQRRDSIDWQAIRNFKPRAPMRARELLTRYYFDTRNLALHGQSVELRVAAKGLAFKQVIKIGNGANDSSPMMRRGEFPGILDRFRPRLRLIDKKAKDRDETIAFLKKTMKGQGRPKALIAIEGQRRRRSYHPDGDKNITVEFAADLGTGINIHGFTWDIMQIELEIKENNSAASNDEILIGERGLLTDVFSDLQPSFESKPTPGFRHLSENPVSRKKWSKLPSKRFECL